MRLDSLDSVQIGFLHAHYARVSQIVREAEFPIVRSP